MPASLMPLPRIRFFNLGVPLAGGLVYTYTAGTTTPKNTYVDYSMGTVNANPIVLDSNGEADIWLDGFYKIRLTTATGTLIWERDNISSAGLDAQLLIEWVSSGWSPVYISATQFKVSGDRTAILTVNRRLKLTVTAGTLYSTITNSIYAAGYTTVTVANDSGTIDSGISTVYYGAIGSTNVSFPTIIVQTGNAQTISGSKTFSSPSTFTGAISVAASTFSAKPTGLENFTIYGTDSGAADAYVITPSPALASYVTGHRLVAVLTNANTTTTPTINVNGLGTKTIKREDGTAVVAGDIKAGMAADLVYDGTNYRLINREKITTQFGAWDAATYSLNTVYQAPQDGTVHVYCNSTGTSNLTAYTDGSNPPTTERTGDYSSTNQPLGICMDVRKNDYWKVTATGSYSLPRVSWLPKFS